MLEKLFHVFVTHHAVAGIASDNGFMATFAAVTEFPDEDRPSSLDPVRYICSKMVLVHSVNVQYVRRVIARVHFRRMLQKKNCTPIAIPCLSTDANTRATFKENSCIRTPNASSVLGLVGRPPPCVWVRECLCDENFCGQKY